MTTATAALALDSAETRSGPSLFAFRASKNDRMVAELRCVEVGPGAFRVDALILPVRAEESARPLQQEYAFTTREQARHFVDDAAVSLEYTGCVVVPLAS